MFSILSSGLNFMLTDSGTIFFLSALKKIYSPIYLFYHLLNYLFNKYSLNTCFISNAVVVNIVLGVKMMILAIKLKYQNMNEQNLKDKIQEWLKIKYENEFWL